ncbi:family 2A encapsulin nanocompartment cargo protein cysteine desulfurase [Phyllobacterium zundukense]|jgi:cysteine desulfurase/selenocysteine lyase|uniref:SufS family cysteine desulfurase n=1 Tax=Phyllobacterium zundukense TaxID=1867719 RepID=A0ACD4D0W0_9HYPH|nr:family 2A encapsulin nanocompartment cargo protein cysteine desulfurase [Phyllobacterium zundukense]UXN59461.1 SufS family cysteine desulfurase [Phyllobacterium zundukense]
MVEISIPLVPETPTSAGFPDVALLEQMANEFFRAVPGGKSAAVRDATGVHGPATAGVGFAPPSIPVSLPLASMPMSAPIGSAHAPVPGRSATVPVIPVAAPFGVIPATPDPNLGSIAQQHGASSPALYVTSVSQTRPPLISKAIPSLDQTLPNEAELKGLLASHGAGPSQRRAGPPSSGGENPYFLRSVAAPARDAIPAVAKSNTGFSTAAPSRFDANLARRDFPILSEHVNGKPLIWLDNAATTHKPRAIIDRLRHFYEHENSNIHRAAHTLAARATDAYEGAREQVRHFINAGSVDEIVFVRGTTEAINLVADTWGRAYIGTGDEILITHLEHHANIVPWFRLAKAVGAILRVAPVDNNGDIIIEEYAKLLGPRTKLVSLTQVANAIGTVTPAVLMVAMAHAAGAKVLVDGAQSVSHMRSDVRVLDADWFVFSGHKIFGPTGIGVLYGKKHILEEMPPYQSGGNMIADVTFEEIKYQPAPTLFEAGTGNIADAVGLGAALGYLEQQGMEAVSAHEHALIEYCSRQLSTISGVRIIGNPKERAGVVSFVLDGMKSEDVGKTLANDGIAVRSGHHCAQPILRRLGVENSVRPSFALYNTHADIDALIRSVRTIKSKL